MSSFYNPIPKLGDPNQWPDSNQSQYESNVLTWCNAAQEEAAIDQDEDEDLREMERYIDYLMGKQWPKNRPSHKSAPINNKVLNLFWEVVAVLTDIRAISSVKTFRREYQDSADVLNKCIQSWWAWSGGDQMLALTIIWAFLSTGYAKFQWNPQLRNGEGDFEILPISPRSIKLLKPSHTLQSSEAVIYESLMPLSFFRRKYPVRGSHVTPDLENSSYSLPQAAPSHVSPMLFNRLAPQMRSVLTGGNTNKLRMSAMPCAWLREFWFKDDSVNLSRQAVFMGDRSSNWWYTVAPGQALYPRGRLIVLGGRTVLYDGPNPNWHGQHPFACLRLNHVPWKFGGISEMRSQMPLQDIVNNVLAGIMDMVKKAVNPSIIGPRNAFDESVWKQLDMSMPGAKASYNPMAAQAPTIQNAGNLPSFVPGVMATVSREMDRQSGLSAVSDMLGKKQVPSSDTFEAVRDAKSTPMRLKGRNIEQFLVDIGQLAVPSIFQFYTARRRMFMLGEQGLVAEDFDFEPGTLTPAGKSALEHMRNFSFTIPPGTLLNVNRMQRTQELIMLRKNRDIDRRTLYKAMDLPYDIDEVEKNLRKEQAEAIAGQQLAAQGKGAGQ